MIKICFTGDFIPPSQNLLSYSSELQKIIKDKDVSLTNFEAPITVNNTKISKTGNNYKINSTSIQHIINSTFDVVTLANNHIRDYGNEGVIDTLNFCKENGIYIVGAGINFVEAAKPLKLTIKDKKIAILNYCEHEFNLASSNDAGANPFDVVSAYNDIIREKKENDYVLVVYHGGIEYQYLPTPEMVRNFKFMIDIGADTVVAHHTHRYSGAIYYNNKPLLFGLGNFLAPTKAKITDEWLTGLLAKIYIDDSIKFQLYPIKMNNSFTKMELLENEEKIKILTHIKQINEIIEDKKSFDDYWEKEYLKAKIWLFNMIKSNSRFKYRIRKYLPFLFRHRISEYKRNTLLNIVRCESHRNRLIKVLQMLETK